MKGSLTLIFLLLALASCATDTPGDLPGDYEEVDATTVIDAPAARAGTYAPQTRKSVERGEYLVELLGCGSCHTDGALVGDPDLQRALAGSRTGIAFTNPLGEKLPGVIYPSNITADSETGIGSWTDAQIADAIRAGIGRHGSRRITTMPWRGYTVLSDDDTMAIVRYLRSIEPVRHRVPDEVEPGERARHPFVYFGVYQSRQ